MLNEKFRDLRQDRLDSTVGRYMYTSTHASYQHERSTQTSNVYELTGRDFMPSQVLALEFVCVRARAP